MLIWGCLGDDDPFAGGYGEVIRRQFVHGSLLECHHKSATDPRLLGTLHIVVNGGRREEYVKEIESACLGPEAAVHWHALFFHIATQIAWLVLN